MVAVDLVLKPEGEWVGVGAGNLAQTGSGRLQSAVAMSSVTIFELAVGASGPTTGASFSILKA